MVPLSASHIENSNFQSRSKFKAKVVKFTLVSYGPFQTTVGYLSLRLACGRSVHDNTISLALEGHGSMEVQGAIKLEKLVSNVKVVSCMLFIIILYDEFSALVWAQANNDGFPLVDPIPVHLALEVSVDTECATFKVDEVGEVNSPNKYGYLVLLTEG